MDWLLRFLAGFSTLPISLSCGRALVGLDFTGSRADGGRSMGSEHWVEVGFDEVVRDSDSELAVLFDIGGEKVWIPRSQLRDGVYDEGDLTFEIPEWLALEKGLI